MSSIAYAYRSCLEQCIKAYETSSQCLIGDENSPLRQAFLECDEKCQYREGFGHFYSLASWYHYSTAILATTVFLTCGLYTAKKAWDGYQGKKFFEDRLRWLSTQPKLEGHGIVNTESFFKNQRDQCDSQMQAGVNCTAFSISCSIAIFAVARFTAENLGINRAIV